MSTGHGHVTPRDDGYKARVRRAVREHHRLERVSQLAAISKGNKPLKGIGPQYPMVSDRPMHEMSLAALVSELNQLHNLSDAIYEVRSRAIEDERWGPYKGNSWDHPAVSRYNTILAALDAHLELAGEPKISG